MMRAHIYIVVSILLCACGGKEEPSAPKDSASEQGKLVFSDDFERARLGDAWKNTGGSAYEIVNGSLKAKGAHNKPLWLTKKLPRNARVEFTARSESPAVDIKVEVYGDGRSFAKQASYTATSYVVILGGWNNSRSIIARMDEHGEDRKVRKEPKGEKGKKYSFSITRKGPTFEWNLDGAPFLELTDPSPLEGEGHEYFAINNWESEVYFDDLAVWDLGT